VTAPAKALAAGTAQQKLNRVDVAGNSPLHLATVGKTKKYFNGRNKK